MWGWKEGEGGECEVDIYARRFSGYEGKLVGCFKLVADLVKGVVQELWIRQMDQLS